MLLISAITEERRGELENGTCWKIIIKSVWMCKCKTWKNHILWDCSVVGIRTVRHSTNIWSQGTVSCFEVWTVSFVIKMGYKYYKNKNASEIICVFMCSLLMGHFINTERLLMLNCNLKVLTMKKLKTHTHTSHAINTLLYYCITAANGTWHNI
jgi:hypothetical protein